VQCWPRLCNHYCTDWLSLLCEPLLADQHQIVLRSRRFSIYMWNIQALEWWDVWRTKVSLTLAVINTAQYRQYGGAYLQWTFKQKQRTKQTNSSVTLGSRLCLPGVLLFHNTTLCHTMLSSKHNIQHHQLAMCYFTYVCHCHWTKPLHCVQLN